MKNTISKAKIPLDRSRLDTIKESINELEDAAIDTIQGKAHGEKD